MWLEGVWAYLVRISVIFLEPTALPLILKSLATSWTLYFMSIPKWDTSYS